MNTNPNDLVNATVKPGFSYSDGSYEESTITGGLTKREYFSAKAMQGMLSNPTLISILEQKLPPEQHADFLSTCAVEQADSIMKELNKSNG